VSHDRRSVIIDNLLLSAGGAGRGACKESLLSWESGGQ
jgi:hypothetical protein